MRCPHPGFMVPKGCSAIFRRSRILPVGNIGRDPGFAAVEDVFEAR